MQGSYISFLQRRPPQSVAPFPEELALLPLMLSSNDDLETCQDADTELRLRPDSGKVTLRRRIWTRLCFKACPLSARD